MRTIEKWLDRVRDILLGGACWLGVQWLADGPVGWQMPATLLAVSFVLIIPSAIFAVLADEQGR